MRCPPFARLVHSRAQAALSHVFSDMRAMAAAPKVAVPLVMPLPIASFSSTPSKEPHEGVIPAWPSSRPSLWSLCYGEEADERLQGSELLRNRIEQAVRDMEENDMELSTQSLEILHGAPPAVVCKALEQLLAVGPCAELDAYIADAVRAASRPNSRPLADLVKATSRRAAAAVRRDTQQQDHDSSVHERGWYLKPSPKKPPAKPVPSTGPLVEPKPSAAKPSTAKTYGIPAPKASGKGGAPSVAPSTPSPAGGPKAEPKVMLQIGEILSCMGATANVKSRIALAALKASESLRILQDAQANVQEKSTVSDFILESSRLVIRLTTWHGKLNESCQVALKNLPPDLANQVLSTIESLDASTVSDWSASGMRVIKDAQEWCAAKAQANAAGTATAEAVDKQHDRQESQGMVKEEGAAKGLDMVKHQTGRTATETIANKDLPVLPCGWGLPDGTTANISSVRIGWGVTKLDLERAECTGDGSQGAATDVNGSGKGVSSMAVGFSDSLQPDWMSYSPKGSAANARLGDRAKTVPPPPPRPPGAAGPTGTRRLKQFGTPPVGVPMPPSAAVTAAAKVLLPRPTKPKSLLPADANAASAAEAAGTPPAGIELATTAAKTEPTMDSMDFTAPESAAVVSAASAIAPVAEPRVALDLHTDQEPKAVEMPFVPPPPPPAPAKPKVTIPPALREVLILDIPSELKAAFDNLRTSLLATSGIFEVNIEKGSSEDAVSVRASVSGNGPALDRVMSRIKNVLGPRAALVGYEARCEPAGTDDICSVLVRGLQDVLGECGASSVVSKCGRVLQWSRCPVSQGGGSRCLVSSAETAWRMRHILDGRIIQGSTVVITFDHATAAEVARWRDAKRVELEKGTILDAELDTLLDDDLKPVRDAVESQLEIPVATACETWSFPPKDVSVFAPVSGDHHGAAPGVTALSDETTLLDEIMGALPMDLSPLIPTASSEEPPAAWAVTEKTAALEKPVAAPAQNRVLPVESCDQNGTSKEAALGQVMSSERATSASNTLDRGCDKVAVTPVHAVSCNPASSQNSGKAASAATKTFAGATCGSLVTPASLTSVAQNGMLPTALDKILCSPARHTGTEPETPHREEPARRGDMPAAVVASIPADAQSRVPVLFPGAAPTRSSHQVSTAKTDAGAPPPDGRKPSHKGMPGHADTTPSAPAPPRGEARCALAEDVHEDSGNTSTKLPTRATGDKLPTKRQQVDGVDPGSDVTKKARAASNEEVAGTKTREAKSPTKRNGMSSSIASPPRQKKAPKKKAANKGSRERITEWDPYMAE